MPGRRQVLGMVIGAFKLAPYCRQWGLGVVGTGGGQIKTAWIGALKRAGLADKVTYIGCHDGKLKNRWKPRFRPHDCRHTWATWAYAATRDLRALMELGGWKSERMVFRYTHVNPDHLAGAIDRLPWAESVQNTKVTQV